MIWNGIRAVVVVTEEWGVRPCRTKVFANGQGEWEAVDRLSEYWGRQKRGARNNQTENVKRQERMRPRLGRESVGSWLLSWDRISKPFLQVTEELSRSNWILHFR